tara:strand:+ start:836 stop:1183 length:348 start_codon:yes stop_codon:yes gene_type:complete
VTNKNKTFGCFHDGFTITFNNGLLLSTRFGSMNYCENKSGVMGNFAQTSGDPLLSDDVEVAVWKTDRKPDESHDWVTEWQTEVFDEDGYRDAVRGYVKIDDWLRLLDWCRNWVER